MTNPFFVVCRSTALRRLIGQDASFVDKGTHIEYLSDNKACLLYTSPSPRDRG